MRKLLFLIFIAVFNVAVAQIAVGMRDTRFVTLTYRFSDGFGARFEQSLYSDNPRYQYFRLAGDYRSVLCGANCTLGAFYGMSYGNGYRNIGAYATAERTLWRRLGAYAVVNPYYDSGFFFTLCFRAGLSLYLGEGVSILADYNTIPVYRESEPQLRVGSLFRTDRFSFSPMLSIPLQSADRLKEVRVLANFSWSL